MSRKNDWFKIFEEKPKAFFRLFCFHFAGGGASTYRSWLKYLPESIEVCAVQLPGRENRFLDHPIRDLSFLIEKLSEEINEYLEKPFVFFGHSMGALVSFELARFLLQKGSKKPEQLFISGRPSPTLPRKYPPIHHLSENLFIEEIKKFEGMPSEIINDPEMREFFFPTLRADLEMCEKYEFKESEKIDIPIKVYGGSSDSGVTESELGEWENLTKVFEGIRMFEGGHFYFKTSEIEFLKHFKFDLEAVVKKVRLRESSSIFFSKPNL